MKLTRIPILLGTLLSATLVQAQAPVIVSATQVGTSNRVRLTFNIPVTPAGATNALADDFSAGTVDPTRWNRNDTPFEQGGTTTAASSVVQTNGVVVINVEAADPDWPGISLETVNSFSASLSQPLVFEVNRVSHVEDADDSRTGVWISSSHRQHYVFFAENEGGGGWQYNRKTQGPGDNDTGDGYITGLVNGANFNDLGNHRIKAILDGITVRLYLDGLFASEVPFPYSSSIEFEFGAYAAAPGDLVTGTFDNARIARLVPVNLSNFSINNGATVTGVGVTSDPKVLELTTTGVNAGSPYTLSVSGIQSWDGTPIVPNSTVAIQTRTNGIVNIEYAAAVLADHPVAYYQMDQIAVATVPNLGSIGTPATYSSTYIASPRSLLTPGPGIPDFPGFAPINTAALFDGIKAYINTGEPLLYQRSAFTIEAWIKPAYLDDERLALVGSDDSSIQFGFALPNLLQLWTGGAGGVLETPYPFPFNEWHHVVALGNGTNLLIYFDGELAGQGGSPTDNYGDDYVPGGADIYIGLGVFDALDVGYGGFPGAIDEVAIYTNALSPARIKAHFDIGYAAALHPTVTITNPVENAAIAPGTTVTLRVQTSAAAGRTVTKVEYYDRFTLLGESTVSPFSFIIPSISEGRHSFTAKAYDDLGVWRTSTPVRLTVGVPKPLLVMVVATIAQLSESDQAVETRLLDSGYDVQLVPATSLSAEDVSEASLVVVPVLRIDAVAETLRGLPVPVLTWDQDLEPTFLFTDDVVDVYWGDTLPEAFINIVNADHPLAAGLPTGVLQVNDYPQEFAWGVPTNEATIIATLADDTTRAVIYAYNKGAALVDGSIAPDRRVFFMLTDDTFLALNDDGLKLFDAAVAWAVIPQFNPPPFLQQGNLILSWFGGGTLQSADALNDSWTDIPGAVSPYSFPVTGPRKFFRVKR